MFSKATATIVLLFIIGLAGCGTQTVGSLTATSIPTPIPTPTSAPQPVDNGYIPVRGSGYDGVIVAEQDAHVLEPRADGYWMPSSSDIAQFEAGLVAFLRQAAPERSPELWQKQERYNRQYAGFTRNGKQFVHGSFFCHSPDDQWRTQAMIVMDGGDCFFQISYELNTGTYSDLMINGNA